MPQKFTVKTAWSQYKEPVVQTLIASNLVTGPAATRLPMAASTGSMGAIGLQMGRRSLTEAGAGEEIAHDFAQRLEGQQLVFGQIDCPTFDPRSVPHQRDDI